MCPTGERLTVHNLSHHTGSTLVGSMFSATTSQLSQDPYHIRVFFQDSTDIQIYMYIYISYIICTWFTYTHTIYIYVYICTWFTYIHTCCTTQSLGLMPFFETCWPNLGTVVWVLWFKRRQQSQGLYGAPLYEYGYSLGEYCLVTII